MRSHIRKWRDGDVLELCADVLVEEESLSKCQKKLVETLLKILTKSNAGHARRAVEDGECRKTIMLFNMA